MIDEAYAQHSHDALLRLTPRELEVLRMISEGLTNAEVASRLHLSVHAIKFHLAGIYRRLSVANRTEAAVMYFRAQAAPVQTPDSAAS